MSISCFSATLSETGPSCDDPKVEWEIFRSDSASHSVGDLISGSQKAMMSSSISMNDSSLLSSSKSHSEAVDSSSFSNYA